MKAERDALKLKKELEELVERSAVEGELREMFSVIRARVQALPGEIASSVQADVRAQVMEEATSKIVAALKELSMRGVNAVTE